VYLTREKEGLDNKKEFSGTRILSDNKNYKNYAVLNTGVANSVYT
jgi:hypothetical protein